MNHIHGKNCGCKDVAFSELGDDLLQAIDID